MEKASRCAQPGRHPDGHCSQLVHAERVLGEDTHNGINSRFSFIGQVKLNPNAFASTGVHNFNTKVMVFLRKSLHIEMQAYNAGRVHLHV